MLSLSVTSFISAFIFEIFDLKVLLEWGLQTANTISLKMTLFFDSWSFLFLSTVTLVCSSVLEFSSLYMQAEKNRKGFTYLVLLFVLSMAILIFSLNMVSIYLGWDGLGVVSFALVIYYESDSSLAAGMLTALSNRIGDVFILFSMGLLFAESGWDFMLHNTRDSTLVLFIILASMTKSAQVPFSAWLPAAMAAPTPVSALVHSSTLVTAGVYLMIRFNFEMNSLYFFYVGCLTGVMAGAAACFELDLKKIVALSTLSQLGIMMTAVSLEMFSFTFFHLVSHAFFKALIFICVGLMIFNFNSQDGKTMGLVKTQNQTIFSFFLISCASLCGLFFLSGFFSKDLIFETILSQALSETSLCLFSLMVGLSASYSLRLIYGSSVSKKSEVWTSSFKEGVISAISMTKLALMAVFGGWVLSLFFFNPSNPSVLGYLKYFVLSVTVLGALLGFTLLATPKKSSKLITFFNLMLFLPDLSSKIMMQKIISNQRQVESIATGWSDLSLGLAATNITRRSGVFLSSPLFLPALNFYLLVWALALVALS